MGRKPRGGLLRAWVAFVRERWGWFMYWLLHPTEYTDRGGLRRSSYWWLRTFVGDVLVRLIVVMAMLLVPFLLIGGVVKAVAG